MEEQEIIEGNKLIAVFDGWEKTNHVDEEFGRLYLKDGESKYQDSFRYELSWDWLMPVVEKIVLLDNQVNLLSYRMNGKINTGISGGFRINHGTKIIAFNEGKSLLLATWQSVIQFIKHSINNK